MKRIGHIFLCIIFIFGMTSFKNMSRIGNDNSAVILMKIKYNAYGWTGFGGTLKVRNTLTNETYESKTMKGFSPFVMIANVPYGTYSVEELQIISGPYKVTIKDKSEFNEIQIAESKIYYLGNYITKKVPPLLKLNFLITNAEADNEGKIYKQLKKDSEIWSKYSIDYEQMLFKSDSTKIEIKNSR